MGTTRDLGTRAATFVPFAPTSSTSRRGRPRRRVLAALVDESAVDDSRAPVVAQTSRRRLHPVFFGSAITGAGVDVAHRGHHRAAARQSRRRRRAARGHGVQDRSRAGRRPHRLSCACSAARIRVRDRVDDARVTGIEVFDRGTHRAPPVRHRRRDRQGAGASATSASATRRRAPRSATASTTSHRPRSRPSSCPTAASDRGALHAALTQLAEQDPLIDLRRRRARQELHLSLYGEVQKEVIQATLPTDFGLDVEFRETTPICIERPRGIGDGDRDDATRRGRRSARSSPASGCASTRHRSAPASRSATRSSSARCRLRS